MWLWKLYMYIEFHDGPYWMCDLLEWIAPHILCIVQHEPVDDQCGLPAHRFCIRCRIATPFEALSR